MPHVVATETQSKKDSSDHKYVSKVGRGQVLEDSKWFAMHKQSM